MTRRQLEGQAGLGLGENTGRGGIVFLSGGQGRDGECGKELLRSEGNIVGKR